MPRPQLLGGNVDEALSVLEAWAQSPDEALVGPGEATPSPLTASSSPRPDQGGRAAHAAPQVRH